MGRKLARIREVLLDTAESVKNLEDEASREYVKTDEFQELLERTLRQASDERNEKKRKLYSAFLAGDIASPGIPYDEKIRILRTMEQLHPGHIRILKAMLQEPEPVSGQIGSISGTLAKRTSGISQDDIRDLARDLSDMRLANLGEINTMMTATGAEQLMNYMTPFGRRLVSYILEASDD
jgi:hypothetical protein